MANKNERTLVVVKPDGVQRGLIGEVIKRYERVGLKLVGIKMFVPDEDFIEKHYLVDPEWVMKVGEKSMKGYAAKGHETRFKDAKEAGEFVLGVMKKYLSASPVVAMVWEGLNAVAVVRKITGGTEPATSDVGTIRGDYTIDSYDMADDDERAVRNIIHASGTVEEAEKEIPHWFKDEELNQYKLFQEKVLYDVNLDGILE